ncbi:MAG: helix-turn-helix transcriptional regulator [Clostridia bacterium]|nr:helix-turn-helix transcriptional regulator [Clostridia bacterium]
MAYNEKIKFVREARNITQQEMAKYLGIHQQSYSRYENGIVELPVSRLKQICKKLNISADYILDLPQGLDYFDI